MTSRQQFGSPTTSGTMWLLPSMKGSLAALSRSLNSLTLRWIVSRSVCDVFRCSTAACAPASTDGGRLVVKMKPGAKERTASGSEITLVPYEQAYEDGFEDMMRRVPDVSRLERATGFRPRTPLATIIADVVADQRERLQRTARVGALAARSPR